MKRDNRYGVRSLERDFPNEEACLNFLFDAQHSRQCSCGGTYKLRAGRKQFQCGKCRFAISPLAGTIFHKSDTPLTLWFKAILAFSNAKSGVSAKYMERELEVTYKTAWRILMLIRKALGQNKDLLKGTVEMDVGYLGGRFKSGKYNAKQSEAMAAKTNIMAAVERGGDMRVKVVPDAKAKTHAVFLAKNVERGSNLMTDNTRVLNKVVRGRYNRRVVSHGEGEYARADVYVNNVESFFSHLKRSITGTHKAISKKYAQAYLDGFVFHYNNRHSDKERFALLLGTVLHGAK